MKIFTHNITIVFVIGIVVFSILSCDGFVSPKETSLGSESENSIFAADNDDAGDKDRIVESITTIVNRRGGRVDWGPNDVIAHSRFGVDGYYDLWTMKTDGSDAQCLTCNDDDVPQLHNGQPAWHPSGDYIVFQCQDPDLSHTKESDALQTQPGFGKHNNLWVTNPGGSEFYQLTNITEDMSILHAHFSHDGQKLMWAQRMSAKAIDWTIMIAEFVEKPIPHLTNITPYRPLGMVWYETHSFSPDNSKVLFTAGTGAHAWAGFDIWEMDISTQKLTQLTNAPDVWDEHAHYSPDSSKIVWVSSRGYPYDSEAKSFAIVAGTLKLEYWMMNADGSNKQRLTYFNEPGYDEYVGQQVIAADSSWRPDGNKLIATVLMGSGRASTQNVIIELDESMLHSNTVPHPPTRPVKSIQTIVDSRVKTVDWNHELNTIAFGKWGADGYVDVAVMDSDGSNMECLTCDKAECPQRHNGNPTWRPSGDYIVFTAEKEENKDEYSQWAIPGSGFNCDLWAMSGNGEDFYRLTDVPLDRAGVIHPHFSHDGSKLFWAERVGGSSGSRWGEWALKLADFVVDADGPHLDDIETYQPGRNHYFYESHAFSPDDTKILYCGNPDGQSDVGFDIYEMDVNTRQVTNLTSSPDDWDEHAQYSPDGEKIVWLSSSGFDIDFESIEGHEWMRYLTTELWMMDADGSNKQRLTYFNEPGYPEYMGGTRTIVSDSSWGPNGKSIVVLVAYEGPGFAGLKSKLVMIELD